MITMAQRIEQLRVERNLSRPALAAALGFPRMAVEKFETGRQTPTQEQQEKLAAYFGVSVLYLRGENHDRVQVDDWMDSAFSDTEPVLPAAPKPMAKSAAADSGGEGGAVFDAFLKSQKFQDNLRKAVLETLQSPEGQALLAKAVRKELGNRQ